MTRNIRRAVFCTATLLILGYTSKTTLTAADDTSPADKKARASAVAVLAPATNGPVKGQVTFTQEAQGVRVVAAITGLTPGKHGFHIHEKGDCSAADFTSAGGHWNPLGAKHGSPDAAGDRHAGDFGNIEADAHGAAKLDRVFQWLSFTGTNTFIGKAVVVHANPDDLTSQPAGNAGPRIACGVVSLTSGK